MLRHRHRLSIAPLAVILLSGLLTSSSVRPADAHHSNNYQAAWYVDNPDHIALFYNYDVRATDVEGVVDWPVHFIFGNNAHVGKIKTALCVPFGFPAYCDAGGPMSMGVIGAALGQGWLGFDTDSGIKMQGYCSDTGWKEHLRVYAPHTNYIGNHSFYSISTGYMVIGTAHLDYRDDGGCPGRAHGYSEVAENNFIAPMQVANFSVAHNCCNYLGNQNICHVAYHGTSYPHYYTNTSTQTWVWVP